MRLRISSGNWSMEGVGKRFASDCVMKRFRVNPRDAGVPDHSRWSHPRKAWLPDAGLTSRERLPAKARPALVAGWVPVRVKKTRQNKQTEPPFRFNRNGKGTSARGSTGRGRPGNLPHSGDLSAGGALLPGDSGQAPPPSDKDARWHDRAPAERQRDRRRVVENRSPAAPRQSAPKRPSQMDSPSRPAATSGLRLSQTHAGRASTETPQH